MPQKIVPHHNDFAITKKFSKAKLILLICITALNIIIATGDRYLPSPADTLFALQVAVSLAIIAFIACTLLTHYFFFRASITRRKGFIDNSLGAHLAGQASVNYFSNDAVTESIHKMGVNCFENVLFTHTISGKMLWRQWTVTVFVFLIFLLLAFTGNKGFLFLFIQLTLPALLLTESINLTHLFHYSRQILDTFKSLFDTIIIPGNPLSNYIAPMLHNIIEYEALLASTKVLLSGKVFNAINPSLSEEWEKMKLLYQIQTPEQK